MNRSRYSLFLVTLTACACLGSLCLRSYILRTCFDGDGLLQRGSHALLGIMVFCVVWALVKALLCSRLRGRPGTAAEFSDSKLWRVLLLIGAAAVLTGSLLFLFGYATNRDAIDLFLTDSVKIPVVLISAAQSAARSSADPIMALCGAFAACCLASVALFRSRLKDKAFWLSLVPVIYTLARLIYYFRTWSRDPLVIDFAPHLLASATGVLSLLFLAGYDLKVGRRATTVFWCLCTAVYTAMLLPDAFLRMQQTTLPDLLIWFGVGLFCFISAVQLLTGPEPAEAVPEQSEEPEGAMQDACQPADAAQTDPGSTVLQETADSTVGQETAD